MTHDVTETDSHTVIDEFFQNNVYLRKFEDNMESEFLIFTQEVIRSEASIETNNKPSKIKTKKAKKVMCSKMLRRLHLYEMKITPSNVVESKFHLMNDCIDQNGNVCGAGSFCCDYCCIPLHKNCVRESSWVRNDSCFCCHICMTGDVEFNQEGYFKCIKNSLYKFVFLYQGLSYTYFQTSISIIN